MFSAFNLSISRDFFGDTEEDFDQYIEIGEEHLQCGIESYKKNLERFIKNNTINGSELQENWFPEIEADIFISHSHGDKDLANALAGWLYVKFKLKVFIDSNVWGYSKQLLEEINDKYSNKRDNPNGGYLYSHNLCNMASQHVNIMLSAALQKMIDKVECVMLLNTERSVKVFQGNRMNTYSPWIYSEILCTQIVRKKPLLCYRDYKASTPIYESDSLTSDVIKFIVSYDISLDHLIDLTEGDLMSWLNRYNQKDWQYPLDALYYSTHPNELYNTKKFFNHTFATGLKEYINGNNNRRQFKNTEHCNCFGVYLRCSENCDIRSCPLNRSNRRIE